MAYAISRNPYTNPAPGTPGHAATQQATTQPVGKGGGAAQAPAPAPAASTSGKGGGAQAAPAPAAGPSPAQAHGVASMVSAGRPPAGVSDTVQAFQQLGMQGQAENQAADRAALGRMMTSYQNNPPPNRSYMDVANNSAALAGPVGAGAPSLKPIAQTATAMGTAPISQSGMTPIGQPAPGQMDPVSRGLGRGFARGLGDLRPMGWANYRGGQK